MLKACACAGEQGSRGAGEQRSRGAEEQGSRGAGEQGSRGAGEQGRVQCALFFPLCPSAPLHFKLVRNAGIDLSISHIFLNKS
ncbi:MAG: hypothetical protein V7L23_21155 [Nostoc sp.]|uniref:hypothetical protein n=1 Tax=Nostoc sp. TaxID=1180 RepID=UPI002FF3D880